MTFLHLVLSYQMDTKSPATCLKQSKWFLFVKMMYDSIAFDFPFRITCSSYQIHRPHPWIRKLYYKNRVISAKTPIHTIFGCFKICIILFSYLVKHISRFRHLFLFASVVHFTSPTKRAYDSFHFDVKM